ncbi:MAG: hypothetical protein DRQ39_04015 [Gammaproteobacteria bacterium]|nr:MAG: hypothetical protein DRQ39_04015 [Gammaproteobacteria bacterium]
MSKLTRQQAINAMCKSCIYDEGGGNGTWRDQTEGCTAPDCPLYEHRPLSSGTQAILKQERYDALSPEEKVAYDKRAREAAERMGTR